MQLKRVLVGAAALSLPLTALAGAPAQAGHRVDDPEIKIKALYYDDGDLYTKVKYKCDTEGHHDKWGEINVTLEQRHRAKYSGDKWVKCDNEWDVAVIELEKDWGHLKRGRAVLKAEIEDPQGETAEDEVKVKFH